MTTINDRQVLADYANETSEYLIGKNPDFSLDGWDRSGATAAATEIIGQNLSKLFSSWGDVAAYRERQYQWAEKTVASAEASIGRLSSPMSAEGMALRKTAEVTAQSMRNMGDLAASQVPKFDASSATNVARAASFMAEFAKAAGTALTLGQMAAATYDAAQSEITTHEVMATAAGTIAGLVVGGVLQQEEPLFLALPFYLQLS
jgi:hypothetical protein